MILVYVNYLNKKKNFLNYLINLNNLSSSIEVDIFVEQNRMNQLKNCPRDNCGIRKRKYRNQQTISLILLSFSYIIGNIPYTIYYIFQRVFKVRLFDLQILLLTSNYFITLDPIFKMIIYYNFNKPFQKQTKQFINKILNFLIKVFQNF